MTKADRIIKFAGQNIALGGFALLAMLVAIVLPTVSYSMGLHQPTPAELLVAISIGMFASVLYLWVLDATNTLPFRSVWVSRGVYGAAIVSILGTSIGVYKDSFTQPFPHQGEWLLSLGEDGSTIIAQRPVALVYSRHSGVYWGYGDSPASLASGQQLSWVKVTSFDPVAKRLELLIRIGGGDERVYVIEEMKETKRNIAFSSTKTSAPSDKQVSVQLARRNI
jgi:hypothetical protein